MKKEWNVEYDHKDGRNGIIKVTTEVIKVERKYGNGKYGKLTVGDFSQVYDLRYNDAKDLHKAMLKDYFGKGFVKATKA